MKTAILVIGQGEIGKPFYEHLDKAHQNVIPIDIDPVDVRDEVSFLHVCYPFTEREKFLTAACAYATKYRPETIVVHSTVAPGTTRAIEELARTPCVYSPVRGKHTKMADDLLHYKKFVAGKDPRAVERAARHLEQAGFATDVMSAPETLELAKLCETTYFGLLIAWAQEMDRFARAHGASYEEIPRFFTEVGYLPKHMFLPGYIGGHCVIPNISILKQQASSELLDAIVASNERKAKELGEEATRKEHGKTRARIEPRSITTT